MICNCGKPAKYELINGDSSCNKRNVCKTYDELHEQNKQYKDDIYDLIRIADSLRIYRESTSHYQQAEFLLDKIKEQYERI